jgi:predicted CoA-substrate-specific enzyme activase
VFVCGVDIGAATAKAVILKEDTMLSFSITPTGSDVLRAAKSVTQDALQKSGLSMGDLEYVISTGYGRRAVPFRNKAMTEIICHAAGVSWMVPEARTVIDIGGQDSKVIGLGEDSHVSNFIMNDKCAAGTGRFLEVMAGVLDIGINDMGPISLQGQDPCAISSTCTVFAESEMVTLRAQGKTRENIIAGIHKAMARRVAIMGNTVGFKKEVVFTGGVAKNVGMKKALEEEIKLEIMVPDEPQIMGALGAALLAKAEVERTLNKDIS